MFASCIHMLQDSPYRIECEAKGRSHEEVMRDIYLKSRDNARTPMQWDDSLYAGFGTVQPWIDVNPNYKEVNVEKALADPDSVLHYYRELIRLRKRYDVIVYGDYSPLLEEHSDVFAYRRTLNDETLIVVASFSEREQMVDLGEPTSEPSLLLANYPLAAEPLTALWLRPFEARIYLARNNIL